MLDRNYPSRKGLTQRLLARDRHISYDPDMTLSRRTLLQIPLAAFAAPVMAQEKPWRAAFLSGGFDGEVHHGGLKVQMLPGWKTYWRVPGAGGIPPEVSATGANIKAFIFEYPLPHRSDGEEGQSIGYKDEVVFPFRLVPVEKSLPIPATFMAFLGVCEIVCIPVKHEQQVELGTSFGASPDLPEIQRWRMRVPQLVEQGPVQRATAGKNNGKPVLALTLGTAVKDIFVEGNALHYFAAPQFAPDGLSAMLEVHGAKSIADLKGQSLRVTLDTGTNGANWGLEQRLTVV